MTIIEYFFLYVENEIKSLSPNEKGNEVEFFSGKVSCSQFNYIYFQKHFLINLFFSFLF